MDASRCGCDQLFGGRVVARHQRRGVICVRCLRPAELAAGPVTSAPRAMDRRHHCGRRRGGGRRGYRRLLVPVLRPPLAARAVVAACPAQTLSRHQAAVPFSGREVLPLRAASTDDYCWRDRSGSTSAGQAASRAVGLARQSSAACVVRSACADSAAIKTRANIADGRIVLRPGMRPPPTLYNEMQPGFETKVSDADWRWGMGLQYVAISASARACRDGNAVRAQRWPANFYRDVAIRLPCLDRG